MCDTIECIFDVKSHYVYIIRYAAASSSSSHIKIPKKSDLLDVLHVS